MKTVPSSSHRWLGEYHFPDDRFDARIAFFLAIQRKAPKVLEDLRNEVLPIYVEVERDLSIPLNDLSDVVTYGEAPATTAALHRIGEAKAKWASRWHLCQPVWKPWGFYIAWVSPVVNLTLQFWSGLEDKARKLEWTLLSPITASQLMEDPGFYEFVIDGWKMQSETRTQAVERILGWVKKELNEILDEEEKKAKKTRMEKTPRKTSIEHFDWLVQFQILEHTYAAIAKIAKSKVTSQTVSDGVKSAAEVVIGRGWEKWLREGKPGRPPKV